MLCIRKRRAVRAYRTETGELGWDHLDYFRLGQ
jgi:hypothetical protein